MNSNGDNVSLHLGIEDKQLYGSPALILHAISVIILTIFVIEVFAMC